jgi:hypothetical protein
LSAQLFILFFKLLLKLTKRRNPIVVQERACTDVCEEEEEKGKKRGRKGEERGKKGEEKGITHC